MDHARRVLEFDAILGRLARLCETEPARALAQSVAPSPVTEVVWHELARTTEAYDLIANASVPGLLAIRDLAPALIRAKKGGAIGAVELAQIADLISALRNLRQFLTPRRETAPLLWIHAEVLPLIPKLEQVLRDSIDPAGEVRDTASQALGTLRQRKRGLHNRLIERIQQYTNRHRDLLSDAVYTVRDGRYVVPVKAEHKHKIRGIVHDSSASGATVYLEPEDVLQMGNQLREAEAAEREEVAKVLAKLSAMVGEHADELIEGIAAGAALDLLFAKAKLAYEMKATLPLARAGNGGLEIQGGRHPILEEQGVPVVPLDMEVGYKARGLLITGPNTGGKTVAIKCVGLFALMAQSGLYVPARHCVFSPFSQVWADIGDEQSLQQSLSTFSGHIKNIAAAIKGLKSGALVLFDEIGAGTDPAEGAALAKAILRHLVDNGATVVASTHYGELKAFAYDAEGFANAAMEFDGKSLKPTYRLIMGAPGSSHALKIADRYGIPPAISEQARANLEQGAAEVGAMFEKLEQAQRQARIAQGEADRRLNELKRAEKRAEEKLAEADEIRRTVHAKANEQIQDALRDIRNEAAKLFDELKKGVDEKKLADVRAKLKNLQSKGDERASGFEVPKRQREEATITKGMTVKAEGYTQNGVVLEDPREGIVLVQMGPLRVRLPQSTLTPLKASTASSKAKSTSMSLQRATTASTEIHLRAMRAEDAEQILQKFIDESLLAGIHQVRIVHGKGEGILRKLVQDFLRKNREVATFRDGEPAEGGQGVTIAIFR